MEDDGGLSSACHCSQARQKAVCIIMGCHLISHERGKEVPVYVRARTQGWEVRGARSLAQIVFYRPSRFALAGRRDDRDQVGRFLFSSSLPRKGKIFGNSFALGPRGGTLVSWVSFVERIRQVSVRSDETSSSVVALQRRTYRDRQIAVVRVIKSGNVRFKYLR